MAIAVMVFTSTPIRHWFKAWTLRARGRRSVSIGGLPGHPSDFPDPFVVRVGSLFYAYATNARGSNVQVMTSPDLLTWQPAPDALPRVAPWAATGFTWAPVVLQRHDRFVLYYTVREPKSGRQAISRATADAPGGPFVDDTTEPFIFQLDVGGSIDPSPFVDEDGRAYLLWKSDENALDRPSRLWTQPLSADGLTLEGEPTQLLAHTKSWERPLVEAPSMVRHDGWYYLFYSANWWESPHYCVGMAIGPSPLGPFRKVTTGRAWLASSTHVAGPGGQEFFTDRDGNLYMAYHAWTPGTVGYANGGARSLRISRIEFDRGLPMVRG